MRGVILEVRNQGLTRLHGDILAVVRHVFFSVRGGRC